jgi:hypothetical protein
MNPNDRAILHRKQIAALRAELGGRPIVICFGAGVDSTAMLVALRAAGIRPAVITFADTNGEKPESIVHLARMNVVLAGWGWPLIRVCRKATMATTGYSDLYGNCWTNETLPSLAFGLKSCSIKWKQVPQDQFIKGAAHGPNRRTPHPVWEEFQHTGKRIVKLIGYDCGKADRRRAKNLQRADADFDYTYPLQIIGWTRQDCVEAITNALGADMVPIKGACFFCPASKTWELFWLAAHHPDLLEQALLLERRALTGRHSRFDEVEFGATWDELVHGAERFPSSKTTVGLGRSFSWCQWARVHNVVDREFVVLRSPSDRQRFLFMADQLRGDGEDNAMDGRHASRNGPRHHRSGDPGVLEEARHGVARPGNAVIAVHRRSPG